MRSKTLSGGTFASHAKSKKTSIGNSKNSRPRRRGKKVYRGQGRR